ncbi:redox-active disulfide protein 2 [Brachyspira pilosicoli P43/6/78]|uniref:Redox-active disulfide protein 2 n=2 Tax=Brachyspira pilosicoli TaxID=52584 RepID=D8IAV4_BRAP9|nr:redox-active disulfide protein 2 [Brachyspira pilosicoli 95/1000]AGA65666.1 redox-active disulfide protein 2 [Brachyspira pilosicoli P43/6/78]PLV62460.1 redox-active disulfide protein 2 [Brachyspira pilosicoli SP16]
MAIKHVENMEDIAFYGVMSTPALVLDDKVLSYGKVLSKEEIIELLKANL